MINAVPALECTLLHCSDNSKAFEFHCSDDSEASGICCSDDSEASTFCCSDDSEASEEEAVTPSRLAQLSGKANGKAGSRTTNLDVSSSATLRYTVLGCNLPYTCLADEQLCMTIKQYI